MENKSNTLIITFIPNKVGNQHTLQAFFDVINDEDCECPIMIWNAGKLLNIAKIFKVIKYRGEREDLSDSLFTAYAIMTPNFLKKFKPISPDKEPSIKLDIIPYTGLISAIHLDHWYDHFTSRNSA